MKPKRKIVVIISGGLDSTVLLYHLKQKKHEVRALSFNYGQRHRHELEYAKRTCTKLLVPHMVVDLSTLSTVLPGSSQTDSRVPVPEGRYDEESMKATVVPNRNMIMLSVAIGHAIAYKFQAVAYGAHAGDHTIYPDCREPFVKALNKAAGLCDWQVVRILRPFISQTKAQIVSLGQSLGVDWGNETYSCYKGAEYHCGRCGTCIERRQAFYLSTVYDPTVYQPSAPTIEALIAKDFKL